MEWTVIQKTLQHGPVSRFAEISHVKPNGESGIPSDFQKVPVISDYTAK